MSRAEDAVVIRNVYYMMAYAFRTLDIAEMRRFEVEDFENILDLFSALLVIGLSSQRRRGFERDYQSFEEEGMRPAGRIDVKKTMALKARRSHRICYCFDALSEDTYKNRVLKTTALYLMRSPDVNAVRRKELKSAIMLMGDVELVDPRTIAWDSLRYHRNNGKYRLLMNVCYLVLHDLLMRGVKGEVRLSNVLSGERLSRLYERFVLEYFRRHWPQLSPRAREIDRRASEEAPSFLPRMVTDVTLSGEGGMLVIDTKCYGAILSTHFDKEILSPANVNQIFSYVMHASAIEENEVSGMLLYAKTEAESVDERWTDMGHTYFCRTLDLGQDFSGIACQLDDIARLVV